MVLARNTRTRQGWHKPAVEGSITDRVSSVSLHHLSMQSNRYVRRILPSMLPRRGGAYGLALLTSNCANSPSELDASTLAIQFLACSMDKDGGDLPQSRTSLCNTATPS